MSRQRETAKFLALFAKVAEVMPGDLLRGDLEVLVRLLELGADRPRITQSELKAELKINQSRLSKLMHRLSDKDLISIGSYLHDRRVRTVTTTVVGKKLLNDLESALRPERKPASQRQSKRHTASADRPAFDFEGTPAL